MSDRYFVNKEVSLHPESISGILKVIRDSSSRTCLYISYRGEDIFLWTAKECKPIAFRKTKLSESYVSKHGEMSVNDHFKKESSLRNFHVLPSLWTGSLFGERVKKSQGEGRETNNVRQTSQAVVPQHPLSIRSWCKLLLTRTLTVDRFDLHRFFGRHVARGLIWIIASKQVFWSFTWRLLALDWWAFLAAMNIPVSEGKSRWPETIAAENHMRETSSQYEISCKHHILSVKTKPSRADRA